MHFKEGFAMSFSESHVGSAGSACLAVLKRTFALERGDTGILRLRRRGAFDLSGLFHLFRKTKPTVMQ